jgi:hypothetical protein
VCQRAVSQQCCSEGAQEADDSEQRLIEHLSLLPSLLLLLIVALALVSFPQMMRGSDLLTIWGRRFESG